MTEAIQQVVLNLLARRDYSRYEIRVKLVSKQYDIRDIENVLDDFSRRGWQSDDRFAEAYICHRSKAGVGPLKIAHELKKKQVDSHRVERYLYSDKLDWSDCIQSVWRKKFNQVPCDFKAKSKQMRFLLQRGFEPDRVQRLLNQINEGDVL